MTLQKPASGTARVKRNCWARGKGVYSMRGELKRGISLNKRRLNRRLRHTAQQESLNGAEYRRVKRTVNMVRFS